MQGQNQPDILLKDLRQQIASGQVVAVVGAGVSIGTTNNSRVASWGGLLHNGVERCEQVVPNLPHNWAERVRQEIDSSDMDDRLAAAEKISSKLRARGEYGRWLRETVGSMHVTDPRVIQALKGLKVPIATTNYDELIEKVTGWREVTWLQRVQVERVLREDETGVLHLHGYWRDPDSVVLGMRSYENLLSDEHVQAMLHALRAMRTILFVGFGEGLADPNFDGLLKWSRRAFADSDYRHYRLALKREVAAIQDNHDPADHIYVLSYGSHHSDLAGFLRTLAGEKDKKIISLTLSEELQERRAHFSVLHVCDGKEHEENHGPLLNRPHYLVATNAYEYSTTIEYTTRLGFQFKCFVDYGSNDYGEMKRLLEEAGFRSVSQGGEESRRAWFLLPEHEEYEEYETPDGSVNNYYSPP
jgi:hypothetical protein